MYVTEPSAVVLEVLNNYLVCPGQSSLSYSFFLNAVFQEDNDFKMFVSGVFVCLFVVFFVSVFLFVYPLKEY